jgi:hypothetical protein
VATEAVVLVHRVVQVVAQVKKILVAVAVALAKALMLRLEHQALAALVS